MTKLVVASGFMQIGEDVRRALPDFDVVLIPDRGPYGAAAGADAVVGPNDPERVRALFAAAPTIRWYHSLGAGVERLVAVPEIVERPDLVLTNNSGPYDVQIAEHVMALAYAASKRLHEYGRQQAAREWKGLRHSELRGATMVVLGIGSIGRETARLARGAGMRVIGVRRRLDADPVPEADRVVGIDALADVAAEADYLAVCAPQTALTTGCVSSEVIGRMKPTAWVINIARGGLIDEAALLAALREDRIGGAALDALWDEPLPKDSVWWTLPNVIITPHSSNSSPLLRRRSLELIVENARRFERGDPLLNVVDKLAGY